MVPWLVEYPSLRTAPDHLRARLRELDPTAEIVYLGDGRWMTGRVRWNRMVARTCIGMIENAIATLSLGPAKRMTERGKAKIQLATLGLQGFRPVAEYFIDGMPDLRIANDFQRSQWMMLNTSDEEVIDGIFAQQDEKKIAAHKDLTDPDRAKDAWQYAFTRSHGVTDFRDRGQTPAAGRTRHITLPH